MAVVAPCRRALLTPITTQRQIVNIGLGFGLPWLVSISVSREKNLLVCGHKELQVAAIFHASAVVLFLTLSLVSALVFRAPKATLTRRKGAVLLGGYLLAFGGYILYYYLS